MKKILILIIVIIALLVFLRVGIKTNYNEMQNNANVDTNNTNTEQNQEENKIVISHNKIENLERMYKFLDNTSQYNQNRISDSIVIVLYTIEGDEILRTLKYSLDANEYELIVDNTQDGFAAEEDRKVTTNKYSGDKYELVKELENDYINLKLQTGTEGEEVLICAYSKDWEKNKDTSRTKVSELELTAEYTQTDELVRYNGILYGKSNECIDYIKNPDGPIGVIDKLIGEEYLPTIDGETNSEEVLGALVNSASEGAMILIYKNQGILYRAVEESAYSFYAKVISSSQSSIIVEPLDGSQELKSSDKISIGLGEHNDALYEVGTTVKITYNGVIMESYPAQIKPIKIETVDK